MAGKEKLVTGALDALIMASRWIDQEARGVRKRAFEAEDEGALADVTKEYKESFDPETYYHFSSNPDITEFDPDFPSKEGIYTDTDISAPEVRGASYFTADKRLLGKGITFPYEFVYPVKIKTKDIFDYENEAHVQELGDKLAANWGGDLAKTDDYWDSFRFLQRAKAGDWNAFEEPNIQKTLQELGYRGFKTNEPQTVGLFFPHRGDVRSVYAKFDPLRAPHGDILASVPLAATVGAGALSQLTDE